MVISHKHEYLWVELPRTSSTTISKKLCTHYAGGKILSKHATYEDLQASFSEVLKLIGLEQKRPLPVRNLTRGKEKHFASYIKSSTVSFLQRFQVDNLDILLRIPPFR